MSRTNDYYLSTLRTTEFEVGDRVRVTDLFRSTHRRSPIFDVLGTIVKISTRNSYVVKWDNVKTVAPYHKSYLALVERTKS